MSGLPNLQKLVKQATPGPWTWCKDDHPPAPGYRFGGSQALNEAGYAHDPSDSALIAAAPDMAALLIECAEALNVYAQSPVGAVARGQLARLADYDTSLAASGVAFVPAGESSAAPDPTALVAPDDGGRE